MVSSEKIGKALHVKVVNGQGVTVWDQVIKPRAIANRAGIREIPVIRLGGEGKEEKA